MTRRSTRKTQPGFWQTLINRSTGELMVLMVAVTVCGSIVVGGGALIVISFVHPDYDITVIASRLAGLLNTLVGLLAGFLAGRTDLARGKDKDEDQVL